MIISKFIIVPKDEELSFRDRFVNSDHSHISIGANFPMSQDTSQFYESKESAEQKLERLKEYWKNHTQNLAYWSSFIVVEVQLTITTKQV